MGMLEIYDCAIHYTCRTGRAVLENDRDAALTASHRALSELGRLAQGLAVQPVSAGKSTLLGAIGDIMATLEISADVENIAGIEEVIDGLNELRLLCGTVLERQPLATMSLEHAA